MTVLVNNIYMRGDWPKYFLDVIVNSLSNKHKKSVPIEQSNWFQIPGYSLYQIVKDWKVKYKRGWKYSLDSGQVKVLEMLLDYENCMRRGAWA